MTAVGGSKRRNRSIFAFAPTESPAASFSFACSNNRCPRTVISVDDEKVDLTIGRRYSMRVPRAIIADVSQPSFRDLPTPGTNEGRDFLNLLKPATPNVLIRLREPLRVRLPGGFHRTVTRLGLHLDNPSAFIDALQPIDHR